MDIEKAYAVAKKHQVYEKAYEEFLRKHSSDKGYTDYVPLWDLLIVYLGMKRNDLENEMKEEIIALGKCLQEEAKKPCSYFDIILKKRTECYECSFYLNNLKERLDDINEIKKAIGIFKEAIQKDNP